MSILKEIMCIYKQKRGKKKEQISNCSFSHQMIGKRKKSLSQIQGFCNTYSIGVFNMIQVHLSNQHVV